MYLLYANTFIFFELSISILGTFSSFIIFLKIYTSKKFLTLLLFSYKKINVINKIAHKDIINTFKTLLLFSFFSFLPLSSPPS